MREATSMAPVGLRRSLMIAAGIAISAASLLAQIPGRNVNMVSGDKWPNGDPYLQRQNEPSLAASTRNPLHLLGGSNDYRTVDLPGLPDDGETGDAWLGLYKSFDGGQRWQSTLLPGYPQDTSAVGTTSPLRGYQAGADPVVRPGPSGLFYYSGIVFDRGEGGKSRVFVARFIDNNNKEAGDPIHYLGVTPVASSASTAAGFIDKPWMAVDVPRAGARTCAIDTPGPKGGRLTQRIPAGNVYVAYSVITGSVPNITSTIMFSRSTDCGVTFSAPVAISNPADKVNQGATIAIDPSTGTVRVAWRKFGLTLENDAIMTTSATFGGKSEKFEKPKVLREFYAGRELGQLIRFLVGNRLKGGKKKTVVVDPPAPADSAIAPFDQVTRVGDTFRTNAYPTMAIDGTGRVYIAWSERGFRAQTGSNAWDASIVMTTGNGTMWAEPFAVELHNNPGHQIMPSLAFAGGKLMLVYYDLREDVSGTFGERISEAQAALNHRRHTIDLRASQADPADTPVFTSSVRVSEYLQGSRRGSKVVEQLQFNPPNLPLFQLGEVPFIGDYVDIAAAPAMIQDAAGIWRHNTAATSAPVFHTAWTDNRDVKPPPAGKTWKDYTPPSGTQMNSTFDPTQSALPCSPGSAGMRNQNVYTSRITAGLLAGSPGNAKPLGPDVPRAFVVFAQNTTSLTKLFRFTITSQPAGGRASFTQLAGEALVTFVDAAVPARSTVSKTLFITSSDPHARVAVAINEIASLGAPTTVPDGLSSVVVLNPDISNPDISNPDISNPDISNPDISNAEVYNPDISNPDISNPDISNPDISNPDISNPDISNVVILNPDISNPDISNPDISNPDISNPDISNPDISNPDISNGSLTDVTWTVTNNGNTTASYDINVLEGVVVSAAIKTQIVIYRTYSTPVPDGCTLKYTTQTVVVANIVNPHLLAAADLNAALSLYLEPGGQGKVTLRIVDPDPSDDVKLNPVETPLQPEVKSAAVNTEDLSDPVPEPPVATPPTVSATALSVVSQPTDAQVSEPIGVVQARTILTTNGVPAPAPNVSIIVAIVTNPSGGNLTGTTTVATDANGIATFPGLSIDRPGAGYQLSFTASAVNALPVASASFNISIPAVDPDQNVFLVTTTADAGDGSLRAAITLANSMPNALGVPDVIRFAIPGAGPQTISLATPLPAITDPVVIDARLAGCAPTVEVNGGNLGPGPGLLVTAGNTTIRGLAVTGFSGSGIELLSGGNRIECSYLGLSTDGVTVKANAANGIHIVDAAGNIVGGPDGLARNVISGNTGEGVRIDGTLATGNVVQGNYIGTDASGAADRGNGASGVYIRRAPANSVVGNIVAGNNGFAGIAVCGGAACGGGDAGTQTGDARGNTVRGNVIGKNVDGADRGNTGFGISIDSASATVVGGDGFANTIAYNAVGVRVFGTDTTGARLSRNSIEANDGLGIDLGAVGVTPNDAGDGDTGPSGLQNFPTVTTAARQNDGTTFIQGTLNSTPITEFVIELFDSKGCDALGNGEGQTWIAMITGISTDGNGDMIFTTTYGVLLATGNSVTATATDPAGNTSEFSTCRPVQAAPQAVGPVGGNGGSAFSISCAPGSVATALRGKAGDDIDRTELWCSPVGGGASTFAGGVGGTGGTDYGNTLTCAAGSVMSGVHGGAGSGTWGGTIVDTLGVLCNGGGAIGTSPTVGNSAGAPPFSLSCPAGKNVVGIFGRQGGLLDSIGIYCQ